MMFLLFLPNLDINNNHNKASSYKQIHSLLRLNNVLKNNINSLFFSVFNLLVEVINNWQTPSFFFFFHLIFSILLLKNIKKIIKKK